ncbi:AMP-binding protein [Henriciella sp.]|uniref:AMP-binding protein n=1 Tax=Henriciella sp. TaxID=1968823 RepID=UPI003C718876
MTGQSAPTHQRSLDEIADAEIATLGDIVAVHARRTPNRAALVYRDAETNFASLDRASDALADRLIADGLEAGQRIGFLDRNSSDFFTILFAAAKARLTLVPINFRLAAAEVEFIAKDAGLEALFVGKEFEPIAAGVRSQLDESSRLYVLHKNTGLNIGGEATSLQRPERRKALSSDIAVQMYTSGTTGLPKGVQLSHHAMIRSAIEGLSVWPAMFRPDAAVLGTMPLFHIAACNLGIAGLYAGARVEIMRSGTAREIITRIAERNIAVVPLPATLIHDIIRLPDVNALDLSHLDTLLIAGSGIQVELLREAQQTLGCGFALSYGMTECCGGLTYLGPADCTPEAGEKLKSAGLPLGNSEIKIVGGDGEHLPPNRTGEILCRTDRVMSGYWNRPEQTVSALKGGWYHSGDAGYLDEDGYLYIVDRIKDMVISGGENIYPAEVEKALFEHPDVADVAVIGVPDARWGEALLACIIPEDRRHLDPEELRDFLKGRLASFKIPRLFEFVDAFPMNASGKVLKREMRDTLSPGSIKPAQAIQETPE